MAGHNKWSKIKRQKGVADVRRSALFSRLIKNIVSAAKEGGGECEHNPALRLAVSRAQEASMPKETIERAISKASGTLGGVDYKEIVYEGYGPNGVAIMIEAMTDNNNRTVASVRYILNKNGGSLGEKGSVGWMFDKKGFITVQRSERDEKVMETAMENGVEEIHEYDEVMVLQTAPSAFNGMLGAFESMELDILESGIDMVASNEVELDDAASARIDRIVGLLEEDDDIQNVYTNLK